jgi:hypothetical protein
MFQRTGLAVPGGPVPTRYADLAAGVFADIIAPDFRAEVEDVVVWRHRWRKAANGFEGLAHLLLVAGAVLAFAAGFFDVRVLSFVAGCCGTLSLALLRFSVYANRESLERNSILERLLHAAGLEPPPSIAADDGPDPEAPPVPKSAPGALGPDPFGDLAAPVATRAPTGTPAAAPAAAPTAGTP